MSNTAIESRAPSVARSTAQRVADGVVAGYIRTLANASAEPVEQRAPQSTRMLDCGAGRASRSARASVASVRRPAARRRALATA